MKIFIYTLFGLLVNFSALADISDEKKNQEKISLIPSEQNKKCPPPIYPRLSVKLEEEGKAIVLVTIGIDGKATNVQLFKSSGYERLDESAIIFATGCQYSPTVKDGKIVEAQYQVPVNFAIEKDKENYLGNSDGYQVSETTKSLIEKNLTKNLQVKYAGKNEIIRTICRLGKIPLITATKVQPFQFYLSDAFNNELRNSNKFSLDGRILNLEIDSMEVSTLGQGSWKVEVFVYLEESSKIKISINYTFDQNAPRRAPCENARVVFPRLAEEIIRSVFSNFDAVRMINNS